MKPAIFVRMTLAAVMALAISIPAFALDLPKRGRPAPKTTPSVPHVQLDVRPVPEISAELLRRVEAFPGIEIHPTIVSMPGALGFWVAEGISLARPDMIVRGREFAHIHPDGSLHATLSPDLAMKAVRNGWAIRHPWADRRAGWEGFVMIYTPLTRQEMEVVYQLIIEGYNFVTKGDRKVRSGRTKPVAKGYDPSMACPTC